MDLSTIIHETVTKTVTEERIRAEVEKRIDAMVVEAIKDQFRSYSDTSKTIEAALKESLKVTDLDLPSFGQTVSQMLRAQIEARVAPIIAGQLAQDMDDLLNLAPKEIKLSKIVETMMQESGRYEDGELGDLVTCIIRHNSHDSTWVYLDPEEHRREADKYSCPIRLLIREDGTIYSGTINGRELGSRYDNRRREFGHTDALEARILSYYACGTKIEIDEDKVSTYRDYD